MCNKIILTTTMALFLLSEGKNRMDSSQWDAQEKLRIIDVNRLWYQEDCYKCNSV